VDTRGRGGVRGRGERGGATDFDLAFLAVEVEVVDIEQERFFGAFSVGLGMGEEVRLGGSTAILRVLRAIGTPRTSYTIALIKLDSSFNSGYLQRDLGP
jgi:hypothetical protein